MRIEPTRGCVSGSARALKAADPTIGGSAEHVCSVTAPPRPGKGAWHRERRRCYSRFNMSARIMPAHSANTTTTIICPGMIGIPSRAAGFSPRRFLARAES